MAGPAAKSLKRHSSGSLARPSPVAGTLEVVLQRINHDPVLGVHRLRRAGHINMHLTVAARELTLATFQTENSPFFRLITNVQQQAHKSHQRLSSV